MVTGIMSQPWAGYRTTVDAIGAATSYDFVAALPDVVKVAVRAN